MENKAKSNNLPQINNKDDREMYNSELEYESKLKINLSLTVYDDMKAQVDPLHDPSPSFLVQDENKSEVSENSSQDFTTSAKYTSGTSDESKSDNMKRQIHDKNATSESGEKQSLVVNSKDRGGISVCDKDNSEVLRNLKEGVNDIAKSCGLQEYREEEVFRDNCSSPKDYREEQELQDNHSSPICTKRKDAENMDNKVKICDSQIDLAPGCIKMMEGCNSCSHINKGTSSEPTSNSQTQTVNHISRSTGTDTNTSTHRTCSSQTAIQDQMNSSVQTTCIQATQECQITPDYTTTSSQTSISKSNNVRRIVIKPWAARKYQDMCMCAELGAPCTCANRKASSWDMVLPRNSSWWPTVKKTLLVIAALIPWVFLIVYSVYYYRLKY